MRLGCEALRMVNIRYTSTCLKSRVFLNNTKGGYSNWHLSSPKDISTESGIHVMRRKELINKGISQLRQEEIYRDQPGELLC